MEYLQYSIVYFPSASRVKVLNLIINGIPSIQMSINATDDRWYCFKPYYKWNTFNT